MYRLLLVDADRQRLAGLLGLVDWASFGIIDVKTAETIDDALALALEFQPHLAFIDLELPQAMGWVLVEKLHGLGLSPLCCMMSREDSPNLLRQSMRSGARDFLIHPVVRQEAEAFVLRSIGQELHRLAPEMLVLDQQTDPVLNVPYGSLTAISRSIILAVRRNFAQSLSLMSIAEEEGMNSKYMGQVFLKDTGLKFTDYLTAYRMLEAKKRLQSTSQRIAAIAQAVGYPHFSAFHSHFRSYFGISPREMRNHPEK